MTQRLYEINTHVWAREQQWFNLEQPDISQVPDEQVQAWADMGFEAVWFLGVWKKGRRTREICIESPEIRRQFQKILPDLHDADIIGSPFSIEEYSISPDLGGPDTLTALRRKLHNHNLKLILDFVPNHLAVDHPWVREHPDRFVQGSKVEMEKERSNYFRVPGNEEVILAHGRDPYFAGWTDTVQWNLFNGEARQALRDILVQISDVCDGVRCDMAMLMTNEIFKRTWGDISLMNFPEGSPSEFWSGAIETVRARHPEFLFIAEVYWGMGRKLHNMGFDYMYDKTFYDSTRSGDGADIRRHLYETGDVQENLCRFIENHDESRAEKAYGSRHRAAAALMFTLPGLKLCHSGQTQGFKTRLPVQLARRPQEATDHEIESFYRKMLELAQEPVMTGSLFKPLYVREAWEGNHTAHHIVTCWREKDGIFRLTVVNLGETQSQAYTEIPASVFFSETILFDDLLSEARYVRETDDLKQRGLYLDLPPGGFHVFDVSMR